MFDSLYPVFEDGEFFSRPEQRRLKSQIDRRIPSSVALVGLPGSGKSSLVRRLGFELTESHRVWPVELGSLTDVDDDSVGLAILSAAGSPSSGADLNALSSIVDAASSRVVLTIDDFDRVAEGVSGALLARLRAILTGKLLGRLSIVTCSTRPLYELCEAVRGSAFYNVFYTLPVTGLLRADLAESSVISHRFGDPEKLYAVSGGFAGAITRLNVSGWTELVSIPPLGILDGLAAMFKSLTLQERAILRELSLADDPRTILQSASPERLSYFQAVGLINATGEFTGQYLKDAAASNLSISGSDDAGAADDNMVLLRRLELGLRTIVRRAINERRIPTDCFRQALDERQLADLQARRIRQRFNKAADECDASNLGDIGMVIRKFWGGLTEDFDIKKAGFDRLFETVLPSRNEEFHHHQVPALERKRANVALHDLLAAIKF